MRFRIVTALVIFGLIVADVWYYVLNRAHFLSWDLLLLVALLVFVSVIEHVSKFTVGTKGIVFEKRAAAIVNLRNAKGADKVTILEAVLKDFSGQEKDIWANLILYRITLRALLRRICSEKTDFHLQETTPMVDMLNVLLDKGLITENFRGQLEAIRNTTFFFEWGTGDPPTATDIKLVESEAPRLLKKLAAI